MAARRASRAAISVRTSARPALNWSEVTWSPCSTPSWIALAMTSAWSRATPPAASCWAMASVSNMLAAYHVSPLADRTPPASPEALREARREAGRRWDERWCRRRRPAGQGATRGGAAVAVPAVKRRRIGARGRRAVPGVVLVSVGSRCGRSRRPTSRLHPDAPGWSRPSSSTSPPAGRSATCSSCTRWLRVTPATSVRGPKHVVTKGATAVVTPAETRALLDRIDTGTLVGLRDRALLSVMVFGFTRVTHHRVEEALEAYVGASDLEDAQAPVFQSVDRAGRLSGRPLERRAVLAMIQAAGGSGYGDHGVPVERGGRSSTRSGSPGTRRRRRRSFYDRTADAVSLDEARSRALPPDASYRRRRGSTGRIGCRSARGRPNRGHRRPSSRR